jgi:hypothetical protein
LRRRAANSLDWDNLAEEVEAVGLSQLHAVMSHLRLALLHDLKACMIKFLTAVLPLICTPAFALDPAYLGYWARNTAMCVPDERSGFRITPTGTTENKAQCSFIKETRDGDGWKVRLSCVREGDKYTVNLRWQIAPNGHLRQTQDSQSFDYVRCR